MNESKGLVNLLQEAQKLSGTYENFVLSRVNDHVIRIALMTKPYFWHLHPNSDETFLGVEGVVILELENQRIEIGPGDTFTVPKGVKHRTSPAGPRSVNLTIERADATTERVEGPSD